MSCWQRHLGRSCWGVSDAAVSVGVDVRCWSLFSSLSLSSYISTVFTVSLCMSSQNNSITHCLKPGIDCSLHVDEFQICYRSSNMSIIERQLQLCLNKLQQWATDNGFQFSNTKAVCMHICQKRGLHLDPQLFLDKSPIPVVEETKFLGNIFDRKLSFVPHLKYFF